MVHMTHKLDRSTRSLEGPDTLLCHQGTRASRPYQACVLGAVLVHETPETLSSLMGTIPASLQAIGAPLGPVGGVGIS